MSLRLPSPRPGTLLASVLLAAPLAAQASPADLAEMSLAELMDIVVYPEDRISALSLGGNWSLRYRYARRFFEGYRDGSKRLSNEEVLFRPGEVRTDKNFPVLPTRITQEAHVAELTYAFHENWRFSLLAPYISQSTEHISIVAGYDDFVIDSAGLGDLSLNSSYLFWRGDAQSLTVSSGISLPTGSIDEVGDTPRASGDQQLPYTMQLGSGTYDLNLGLTYRGRLPGAGEGQAVDWGFLSLAKIRLGTNDRDYRLGNRLLASAWVGKASGRFRPSLRLNAELWGSIHGQDDELIVPGAFPYPAGVTNPSLYGGEKLNLVLGLDLLPARPGGPLAYHSLRIEFGGPLYESLNGPQPGERWQLGLVWGFDL